MVVLADLAEVPAHRDREPKNLGGRGLSGRARLRRAGLINGAAASFAWSGAQTLIAHLIGDVTEVQALIKHPMDSGFAKDADGKLIPAHYIETLNAWRIGQQVGGQFREEAPNFGKVGRNEPCPCGSGKKYKRCCGLN